MGPAFAGELRDEGQPSSYTTKPVGFSPCLLRASMATSSCGLSRKSMLPFSPRLPRTRKMCEGPSASWTYLALKISRTIGMKTSGHLLSEMGGQLNLWLAGQLGGSHFSPVRLLCRPACVCGEMVCAPPLPLPGLEKATQLNASPSICRPH